MRIYREPIEVHDGIVDGLEGPAEFCWRGWLWQVREIQSRWVLTAPWWESSAARAVRDGRVQLEDETVSAALLDERIGWRVVAGRGSSATSSARSGVFELLHVVTAGWWLDRVLD